jgi:cell fate regulator YaaT (PSP1 superfamily)
MTTIVGVRFKDSGKIYYFDPQELELRTGDMVIVDTARGPEMAKIAYERRDVGNDEIVGELKPVIRHAEHADFERMQALQSRHDAVMARCAEKIREHGLPMGLVKTEYSFDGSRLTFYFTSEQRVDFRMLVRDLARTFRSRIELRQIGPRDEAKLLGGIGPCGRALCCATFLPDYARVSIKMAKDQELPLNPSKISGVCGRLLCCLSYEHQQYLDMRAELPAKGDWVQTPDGPGDVLSANVLQGTVTVRLASSGMQENYTHAQIQAATDGVHTEAHERARQGLAPFSDEEVDTDELRRLLDDENATLEDYGTKEEKPPRNRRERPGGRAGQRQRKRAPEANASGQAAPASEPKKSSRSRRRKKGPPANEEASAAAPAADNQPRNKAASAGEQQTGQSSKRRRRRKPRPNKGEGEQRSE